MADYLPPPHLADRFHRIPRDPGALRLPWHRDDGLVLVWDPRPIGGVSASAWWVKADDKRAFAADAHLRGVDFDAL